MTVFRIAFAASFVLLVVSIASSAGLGCDCPEATISLSASKNLRTKAIDVVVTRSVENGVPCEGCSDPSVTVWISATQQVGSVPLTYFEPNEWRGSWPIPCDLWTGYSGPITFTIRASMTYCNTKVAKASPVDVTVTNSISGKSATTKVGSPKDGAAINCYALFSWRGQHGVTVTATTETCSMACFVTCTYSSSWVPPRPGGIGYSVVMPFTVDAGKNNQEFSQSWILPEIEPWEIAYPVGYFISDTSTAALGNSATDVSNWRIVWP